MMSFTGAPSRLWVYWARNSLMVDDDRLVSRLAATVWSVSSSAAPRLTSLRPLTLRAFALVT